MGYFDSLEKQYEEAEDAQIKSLVGDESEWGKDQVEIGRLVRLVQQGSGDAFTALYERTYERTIRPIELSLGRRDIAEEIIQESYLKAYQSILNIQPPEKFQSWLNVIARNTMRDYLRVRSNNEVVMSTFDNEDGEAAEFSEDSYLSASSFSTPEEIMDKQEGSRILRELLSELPDIQRSVLIMKFYNAKKISEIADELGVPENTVKTHISRAKKTLQTKITEVEKKHNIRLHSFAPIPLVAALIYWELQGSTAGAGAAAGAAGLASAGAGTAAGIAGHSATSAAVTSASAATGMSAAGAATAAGAAATTGAVASSSVAPGFFASVPLAVKIATGVIAAGGIAFTADTVAYNTVPKRVDPIIEVKHTELEDVLRVDYDSLGEYDLYQDDFSLLFPNYETPEVVLENMTDNSNMVFVSSRSDENRLSNCDTYAEYVVTDYTGYVTLDAERLVNENGEKAKDLMVFIFDGNKVTRCSRTVRDNLLVLSPHLTEDKEYKIFVTDANRAEAVRLQMLNQKALQEAELEKTKGAYVMYYFPGTASAGTPVTVFYESKHDKEADAFLKEKAREDAENRYGNVYGVKVNVLPMSRAVIEKLGWLFSEMAPSAAMPGSTGDLDAGFLTNFFTYEYVDLQ